MTSTRWAAVLACLALATCCPTLWIQVTKTDPAPWPEVVTPEVKAPAAPASMPNRFDVLESGKLMPGAVPATQPAVLMSVSTTRPSAP